MVKYILNGKRVGMVPTLKLKEHIMDTKRQEKLLNERFKELIRKDNEEKKEEYFKLIKKRLEDGRKIREKILLK